MQPPSNVLYVQFIWFLVALFACALFSFLETAVTALRLFKLKELANTTPRYQKLFKILEERPQQILITILIASNLADVIAAALITNVMENVFTGLNLSGGLGFSLGVGLATICILIFGEVIPKNLAKIHGERFFRSTLWFTNLVYYLLYPFVIALIHFSSFVVSFVSNTTDETDSAVVTEHEIRFLINYINEKGLMEREKTVMLQSVFKLGSKQVKEIMVAAIDIVMLENSSTIQQSFDTFSKYQFSRLPVYQGSKDNVIGMVLQKDIFVLMSQHKEKPLDELVRPIPFIPESMKINQLLREFRLNRMHIAMVINEHGSITGLVTLEDVLEEIVGEIQDEYEAVPEKITALGQEEWLADGGIDLDAISQILNITFQTNTSVTLGGFLIEQLQRLPKVGEILNYKGYVFQVQQASQKRIIQIRIFRDEPVAT